MKEKKSLKKFLNSDLSSYKNMDKNIWEIE